MDKERAQLAGAIQCLPGDERVKSYQTGSFFSSAKPLIFLPAASMAEAGEAPPPPAAGESEIDLESYQIDNWDLDEELLLQQQKK